MGRLWRIDDAGFLCNDAVNTPLAEPFATIAAAGVAAFTGRIAADLDSVYLTGPVARGLAVPGAAELEVVAVTAPHADFELVLQDWLPDAEQALIDAHPALRDARLDLYPYDDIFTDPDRFSPGAFLLKTRSICLWGADLTPELPDYRISTAIANDDIVQIAADIAEARERIAADDAPENVRYWLRQACKHLLWTGFALVMVEEAVYTRDADLCYSYFARHFPGHSADLRRALDYLAAPLDAAGEADAYLDVMGGWMIAQADRWLDTHNPARDDRLHIDTEAEPD